MIKGDDPKQYRDRFLRELSKPAYYIASPIGGGQIQKTVKGLGMFRTSEDRPLAGSYTDTGSLRYPVEATPKNVLQAGIFGPYASKNARQFFDEERKALNPEQVKVFQALGVPIQAYWQFQDDLADFYDIKDQMEAAAEKTDATDKDAIKNSYINSFSTELKELFKVQKKVLESNASEAEKHKKVQELQSQISDLVKAGREDIKDFTPSANYAKVGDREFIKNAKGEWWKATDSQITAQTRGKEVLGLEPGEYWSVRSEVSAKANPKDASPEDKLLGQFINGIVKHINDLYYDIEDIQASDMAEWQKQSKILDIQEEIQRYGAKNKPYFRSDLDVRITGGNVATIGNGKYYKDSNGSWAPMSNSQNLRAQKTTKAFGISESQYWAKKKEYDFAYSNIDTYNKMMEYGISFEEYSRGGDDLAKLISKDPAVYEGISDYIYNLDAKDDTLHTKNGLKKERVGDYIWNELNVDDGIKMILYKQQYPGDHTHDHDIAVYLNNRPDVTASQMKNILLGLGALVDKQGHIKWKW